MDPQREYPDLVRGLLRPEAYPEDVTSVELAETHISYLFLTDRHVYKVKKPVDFGFLDFTTLDKRRYYCHEEVQVNRRMSLDVYLGVVEVRQEGGRFTVDGPGETVDYAVKMQRLPHDCAMDVMLEQGRVTVEHVRALAYRIADFHARAESGPDITREGGVDAFRQNSNENFRQVEKYIGVTVSQEDYDELWGYTQGYLAARVDALERRAAESRVKDGHGDLHTAQIFLHNGDISIIDSIEFNHRFRYADAALDLAFLAMDLDFHGREDLSRVLVDAYVDRSGDAHAPEFLDLFKVYRAMVRGKVTSFRLDDPKLSEQERQDDQDTASRYFRLACSYLPRWDRPRAFVFAGLMGTGKTYLGRELARRWGLRYISSDVVRKELAGIDSREHRYEQYGEGIYSAQFSSQTYGEMFRRAGEALAKGESVVLDASFRFSADRRQVLEAARQAGAEGWVVECVASQETLKSRLGARMEDPQAVSDGRWELLESQKAEWEPVRETAPGHHIVLDTDGDAGETVRRLLAALYAGLLTG